MQLDAFRLSFRKELRHLEKAYLTTFFRKNLQHFRLSMDAGRVPGIRAVVRMRAGITRPKFGSLFIDSVLLTRGRRFERLCEVLHGLVQIF